MIESSGGRPLDTTSAAPGGTRALAALIRERGVEVAPTNDPAEAVSGPGTAGGTIVVAYPERATPEALNRLGAAVGRGTDVVLLEPDTAVLATLHLPVTTTGGVPPAAPAPACRLPEAVTAQAATLGGGTGLRITRPGASGMTACYPVRSTPTLVVVDLPGPTRAGAQPGRLVLVGSADFMTNKHLDEQGNAALAIGLLSRHRVLSWAIPQPGGSDSVAAQRGLGDLLPDRVLLACLQLAIATVVLALWRGRRMGPPVSEQLAVVVRAAETVEGRGRLYAAAQARELAAAVLRAGLRARLAKRLRLPTQTRSAEPDPTALVASVAGRTGRSPVEIGSLLYGSDMTGQTPTNGLMIPVDGATTEDHKLVGLADQLDTVDRQVTLG